jgi:putative glutamine amidotransferase
VAVRPKVIIPARFSQSAAALRHQAVVTARALSQAVLSAGGEPLTVHPQAPRGRVSAAEIAQRLSFADAVLLPGGGDIDPTRYGQSVASEDVYDVDAEQDGFDLAVAQWALSSGVPLLAVCRGLQVVNVCLGGDLIQHMANPHRHLVQEITVRRDSMLAGIVGEDVTISCYHHQQLSTLGHGLRAVATAADGTIEAVERVEGGGWFLGVQWHPEDTVQQDPLQLAVFQALIGAVG